MQQDLNFLWLKDTIYLMTEPLNLYGGRHLPKIYRYLVSTNNEGKLSRITTVKSLECISLSKNSVTQIDNSNFGFDHQMTATFNGSCVLCQKQEQSFNKCNSLTSKISSGGVIKLETKSIPAPELAVDERSFLIVMESGAYSIRSDYHVDVMTNIAQP